MKAHISRGVIQAACAGNIYKHFLYPKLVLYISSKKALPPVCYQGGCQVGGVGAVDKVPVVETFLPGGRVASPLKKTLCTWARILHLGDIFGLLKCVLCLRGQHAFGLFPVLNTFFKNMLSLSTCLQKQAEGFFFNLNNSKWRICLRTGLEACNLVYLGECTVSLNQEK